MPDFPLTIDLRGYDLTGLDPLDGFVLRGGAADDRAGTSVAFIGDVNGDGFDDIAVGAPQNDKGGDLAGEAYVIFGKAGGFGTTGLGSVDPAAGFTITGGFAGDFAGVSVAGAGDVNDDGIDDFILGAAAGDLGGLQSGQAYVIYGKTAGLADIDLTSLAAADGFVIQGTASGDQAGISVSSAGDVNGDGIGDVIVGANTFSGAGQAYVLFGKAGGLGAIDLANLAAADGFAIRGAAGTSDQVGRSVAAGDVNNDGYGDLIVGAPGVLGDSQAYVIFGKESGFGDIDLAALAPADGFVIQGAALADRTGISVSAGDINGDGIDDIIVGASSFDAAPGILNHGRTYVLFGKTSGLGDIDLATLTAADGFAIQGASGTRSGASVSAAGDVNGDGIGDLLIGAPSASAAYVVFGRSTGFDPLIDLATLAPGDGFRITGDAIGDTAGSSVSAAGDINGDGFADIIVGAPLGDDGGTDAGEAYVIFGGAAPGDIDLTTLAPGAGFVIRGDAADDRAGSSVAGAGDVNGDGFDDILVGALFGDNGGDGAGEAYLIFGKASGFGDIDLTNLIADDGFIVRGRGHGEGAGGAVAAAGDVNNDGFDDLLVGAPGGDLAELNAGQAYIVYGRAPTTAVRRMGSAADQAIRGGGFDDTLVGRGGDDSLSGGEGSDRMHGKSGDDRLVASPGRDRMTGGSGVDTFVLAEEAGDAGRPSILDFATGEDVIEIDADDLDGGLVAGPLDPGAFRANTTGKAEDAGDRLIYDTDSGKLWFDADGAGAGGRVLIARLTGAPAIDAGDFAIVVGGGAASAPASGHAPLLFGAPEIRGTDLLIA